MIEPSDQYIEDMMDESDNQISYQEGMYDFAKRQADALERIAVSLEKLAGCVSIESPTSFWMQVINWKDMPS